MQLFCKAQKDPIAVGVGEERKASLLLPFTEAIALYEQGAFLPPTYETFIHCETPQQAF